MRCRSEAGREHVEELETEWGSGQQGGAQASQWACWRRRPRTLSCREGPADESPQRVKPSRRRLAWPHVTGGKACLTQCKRFSRWNRKGIKMPSKCGWVCHPLRELEKSQRIPHYFLLEGGGILEGFLCLLTSKIHHEKWKRYLVKCYLTENFWI